VAGEDRFETTRWSMIFAARARGEPGSREALTRLCEIYWYPLYVFARRRAYSADDAAELTQGFFLHLLEKDALRQAQPGAGRFRAFLLASLKNHMANVRRDALRLKRGGDRAIVSLDGEEAEGRYRREPQTDETPEKAYERQWAAAVLDRAGERLEREFADAGKQEQHRLLSPYLSGDDQSGSYASVARELGTTEAAVKMAVSRLRRRFGRILRDEIAQTVSDDDAVDDELRTLLSIVEQT
jgi:RNA polymerase sigma factor (sigma-70 family)